MPSYYYPTSDDNTGSWTTTPLWSKVDDDPTGTGGEGDSIISSDNSSLDGCILGLNTVTDPGTDSGFVVRARLRKEATGGHNTSYQLGLYESGVNVFTSGSSITSASYAEYSITPSAASIASITDWSALAVWVARTGDTGGSPSGRRYIECCAIRLEVPDAVGGGGGSLQLGSMIRKATKVFFPAELILPPPKPKLVTVL